ncbi:MAG: TonB-dependent receptor [Tannerellaceae bacterium]|jgi:TonB-linked SusC/RagA family outer membrane protein|nr:TonB-dependent receptor [Tannerellaceae bacterium]
MKISIEFGIINAKHGKIVRIMKAFFLFMFLSMGSAFSEMSYSQNTLFTIHTESKTVKDIINEIESQSEYIFFYLDKSLDLNRRVSIKVENEPVDKILDQLFEGTNNDYYVSDRQVIISQTTTPASLPLPVTAQTRLINGIVRDASGPVTGANIVIKGTTMGTVTDIDGRFTLPNVPENATLQISYIGYIPQEIRITNQTTLNIILEEDSQTLDELVVIGYGYVKKSDLTGSVSSVKSEDINKMATNSPAAALQGRAAGVQVTLGSGSPDATASIKIRGVGTPNDTSPLYVVDGFPMNDIDYLNPNDIESMEILKDASATAIYGSRGANGVVLISTKKGRSGPLKVNINAYYGFENLPKKVSMLNSSQYAQLSNEAYANAELDPIYAGTSNIAYNTDWYDAVSQTGQYQNYNASFSGGGERISSMLSVNYYKREGIIKSTDYDRMTFTQNSTFDVTPFLKLSSSFSGAFSNYKRLDATSIFLSSLIAPPDIPVVDPETDYYTGITKIRLENPAGKIERNNSQNRQTFLIGNFNADVTLLPELTFSSRFGIRYNQGQSSNFSPVFYETMDNSNSVNTISRNASRGTDWTWENILTFHKTFKKIHDLTVMGALSAREYNYETFSATKQNTLIESKEFWYFDSATDNPQASGYGRSLAMLSYLGRINYNLLDRYLITFSMRADGSSRFIDSNRWGYFPSGALAWKLSEEGFFKSWNPNWLNSVKVRVGYGEIGNENINSYYPYLTPIQQRQYYTIGTGQNRVNGSSPSGIGNKDAKWETSSQFNVGIDLMFLHGKLNLTADYYIRKTDDILLSQQIPRVSGFNTMVRNVGGMENKGIELTLGYKDKKGDFSYNINANMAYVQNKVTNLGTASSLVASFAYDYALIDLQGAFGNIIRSEVGKPYGQFYGYKTDGIFQTQEEINAYVKDGKLIQPDAKPGDVKFQDLNENGSIDTGDMDFIGSPIPDINYGISVDMAYKNFDLNILFQGMYGNDIYYAAKYYFMRFDGRHNVLKDYLDNYWHGPGTSNSLPIVTQDLTRNTRNFQNSDWYVEDGSYLRLKNIQLGYNFKPNLGKGLKPAVRIYIAAQNLFTITSYSGFEPEVSDISVDRGQYPQARSFMLGTVINF